LEWGHSGSPRPQKIPSAKIRWKFLASILWIKTASAPLIFFPKVQTINAEYYLFLLVQFKDILKEKRRGKFAKVVLSLHDNAPSHRALATQKKLAYLDHPPYPPYLAPSDYSLFPGQKNQLKFNIFRGTHSSSLPRRSAWTDNILNFFERLANVRATG